MENGYNLFTIPWRIHGAGRKNANGIFMGSMLPYIAAPWIPFTMDEPLSSCKEKMTDSDLTIVDFLLVNPPFGESMGNLCCVLNQCFSNSKLTSGYLT